MRYALLCLAILHCLSDWLWQRSSHNSPRPPTTKNMVLFLKVRLCLFSIHTKSFIDKIIWYLGFYWNIVMLSCFCIVYRYFCAVMWQILNRLSLQSLKYLVSRSLQKKFANPWVMALTWFAYMLKKQDSHVPGNVRSYFCHLNATLPFQFYLHQFVHVK